MSFIQYIKDTQGELRHVACPTRLQTVVYTILVVAISIAVSLYLGLFDYLSTTGLSRFLLVLPGVDPVSTAQPLSTSSPALEFTGFATTSSTDSGQATGQ